MQSVAGIDIRKAKSYREADKETIFKIVDGMPGGAAGVNRQIKDIFQLQLCRAALEESRWQIQNKPKQEQTLTFVYTIATVLTDVGKIEENASLLDSMTETLESFGGKDVAPSLAYATVLRCKGTNYHQLSNYEPAMKSFESAMSILEKSGNMESPEAARCCAALGTFNS